MSVSHLRTRVPLALLALAAVYAPLSARAQEAARSTPPVVVVGVADDRRPYAYLDEKGEAAGFNVDVMRAMARVMGFEVGFVPGSREEVEEALRRGSIDVAAAVLRTEQNAAWADFSAPLLEVEVAGGVPGPTADLCLAVRKGNTGLRDRLDQGLETLRINGQFQRLYDERVGIARMQRPPAGIASWLLPGVVVFLLLLLAGLALWLRSAARPGAGASGPPAG